MTARSGYLGPGELRLEKMAPSDKLRPLSAL